MTLRAHDTYDGAVLIATGILYGFECVREQVALTLVAQGEL